MVKYTHPNSFETTTHTFHTEIDSFNGGKIKKYNYKR